MGAILMSKKERERLGVLGWKERRDISLKEAAVAMGGELSSGEADLGRYKEHNERF